MFAAIGLITIGGIMVFSALKGVSITDVFAGVTGDKLDPKGGNPNPVNPQETTGGSAQGVPGAGGALGAPPLGGFGSTAMEQEMNRMISLGLPYKWGGGHSGFSQNGPWDCSGAVSWLMHFLGLLDTRPLVSGEFMGVGSAGHGNVFTIYANPTHVFIYMESGSHAGQCWGTTSRLPAQGGSLKWHNHSTAGFIARHYEGY